jgi:hypothetical protein
VRAFAFLAALAVALGVDAGAAAAQKPSQKFLDEYNAGVDAYRLGRYDEARARLEAAKALEPTLPGPWRFLAAVAQAEGDWPECVAAAREAIRLNPQSSEIVATRVVHDDCRAAWGKPAFTGTYQPGEGAISVTTDQGGSSVAINGLRYGSTPMEVRPYLAGDVEIAVDKTGFLRATRKVTILPNVVTDVDFVLEVDPATREVDLDIKPEATTGWLKVVTGTPGAVVVIDGQRLSADAQGRYEVDGGPHEVEVTAPGYEGQIRNVRVTRGQLATVTVELRAQAVVDRSRTIGAVAVGAGVGFIAVGAATGLLSMQAADRARDQWTIETTRPPSPVPIEDTTAVQPLRTRAAIEAEADQARRLALVSNLSYGVAVVALGVGAYFLVKARPRGDRRVRVAPVLGPSGGGATAELRW